MTILLVGWRGRRRQVPIDSITCSQAGSIIDAVHVLIQLMMTSPLGCHCPPPVAEIVFGVSTCSQHIA
jgi:hypothetical protein